MEAQAPARQSALKLKPKEPSTADAYYKLLDGTGLYPDIDDPNFVKRLLSKYEFADTKSSPEESSNACDLEYGFEISPVQRFVANFLHPGTPYMGALLYHGVGVGKTCAAIQSAEAYLDSFPNRKVFIICPSAIRQGFRRTIFDFTSRGLTVGKGNAPNTGRGCTGNTYLHLAGCLFERDADVIHTRITKAIDRRYEFFGYIEFRNYIRNIMNTRQTREEQAYELRKAFNYRMLIVDEAHNLPDYKEDVYDKYESNTDTNDESNLGDEDEDEDEDEAKPVANPKTEKAEGATLTPYLQRVLENTEGIKLLLMTATPMYNNVFEIYTLLNLLLLNDKKPLLEMKSILNPDGTLVEGAEKILKPIANAYVSFMRGENPFSFPIRLYPEGMDPNGQPVARLTAEQYPRYELGSLDGNTVPDDQRKNISKLPIVLGIAKSDSSFKAILQQSILNKSKREAGGLSGNNVNYLLQAGNIVFPPSDGRYNFERPQLYVGSNGFLSIFEKQKTSVKSKIDASWLLNDQDRLELYSPKLATILRYVKHAEGVEFVFSQFISSGALLIAIALEANGYIPYGRSPILSNPPKSALGGQCALCPKRKQEHGEEGHAFTQARYGLLTGDKQWSPNLEDTVSAAVSPGNKDGSTIKVIIGSKVASEGIDLKYIREVHILDAWWHMNRIEQIIGRGIRFCSHAALDEPKRNTTVFLHAAYLEETNSMESADLYCYRVGMLKEIKKGKISRLLKVYAVDCNLRKDATILTGLGYRKQTDSQRQPRNGSKGEVQEKGEGMALEDMPFSAVCDWMDTCEPIRCDPEVPIQLTASDDSTYSTFSAKFRETAILKVLAALFTEQPWYQQVELIQNLVQRGIPRTAVDIILQEIVNNRLYRFRSGGQEGYIIYKNNYFLFQPDSYKSLQIPMALRIAMFPIKRDEYTPIEMKPDVASVPLLKPEGAEADETMEDKTLTISQTFWRVLHEWVLGIANGTQTTVSLEVERQVGLLTQFDVLKRVYIEKLKTLLYFKSKIPAEHVEYFKQICLEYIWDELIHPDNQVKLLFDQPDISAGSEQILRDARRVVIRYIDPETNKLKYICQDGKECTQLIVDVLVEEDKKHNETLYTRKADADHAGFLYGFLVPKKGDKIVFKTQESHDPNTKPKGGKECAIVDKGHSFKMLVKLGSILAKDGKPTLDLDEGHLAAVGHILDNSTKGCTLLDLVLRYMDILRIKGKRWFFRPVAAYIAGLRGLVVPKEDKRTKVAAKAAAEKQGDEVIQAAPKAKKKPVLVQAPPPPPPAPQQAPPPPAAVPQQDQDAAQDAAPAVAPAAPQQAQVAAQDAAPAVAPAAPQQAQVAAQVAAPAPPPAVAPPAPQPVEEFDFDDGGEGLNEF